MVSVDIQELRLLYSRDNTARLFLDSLLNRKKNSRQTSVERAITLLAGNASRAEVVKMFQEFETIGCGVFKNGRRGQPSRIEWNASLPSIGQAATGKIESVTSVSDEVAGDLTDDDESYEVLTHSFHLRPDMIIELDLPIDFSDSEAQKVADFVKTLPFNR